MTINNDTLSKEILYGVIQTIQLPLGSAGIDDLDISVFDNENSTFLVNTMLENPGSCSPVSTNEAIFENIELSISPNPFNNEIKFSINNSTNLNKMFSIELLDSYGRNIARKSFKSNQELIMDTSSIPNNRIVFFRLFDENHNVIDSGKLVKN